MLRGSEIVYRLAPAGKWTARLFTQSQLGAAGAKSNAPHQAAPNGGEWWRMVANGGWVGCPQFFPRVPSLAAFL
jgi:hypothetical protein